jgi:hypothetical protein
MKDATYYIIQSKHQHFDLNTLRIQRKDAIKKFLGNGTMTWQECQKYGWKVVKVKITIVS